MANFKVVAVYDDGQTREISLKRDNAFVAAYEARTQPQIFRINHSVRDLIVSRLREPVTLSPDEADALAQHLREYLVDAPGALNNRRQTGQIDHWIERLAG